MIEIMLWKFFWTYQKNHAIENHTMENHVRRGLTVMQNFRFCLDRDQPLVRFYLHFLTMKIKYWQG